MLRRLHRRIYNRVLWHPLTLRTLRWIAKGRSRFEVTPGVTIVIVNWNSLNYLEPTLIAVRALSPPATRILVVDNGSTDGSPEFLRRRSDVRSICSPSNLKHWRALDLGFLLARTEFVVALDADAFPIRSDWLDVLLAPLHGGALVSGAAGRRGHVHPCCLAMRWSEFVRTDASFRPRTPRDGWDLTGERRPDPASDDWWDVGERISMLRPGRLALLARTSARGPGSLGTMFGDVVYHNFYAVRHLRENASEDMRIDGFVTRAEALTAWDEAVQRYVAPLTRGGSRHTAGPAGG